MKKQKRKLLSWLLILMMVFSMMPTSVLAVEAKGQAETIQTAEDFAAMEAGGDYILGKDITISAPYAGTFNGTFDGACHTVTLEITSAEEYVGLFSQLGSSAVVQNVITDGTVTGAKYVGGIAGKNEGTIQTCLNQADIFVSEEYAGGITAQSSGGSILECGLEIHYVDILDIHQGRFP